jgi:hypothetical protein
MTFKEIVDMVKRRINETELDTQLDALVKDAVNYAYIYEIPRYDKRIDTARIPSINGACVLPDDVDTIIQITPELQYGEKRVGNVLLTKRDIMFTIAYSIIREQLVNDTDVLDLSLKFQYLLTTYACYMYWQFKKKTGIANSYLEQYQLAVQRLFDEDNFGEESVQDVYETVVEE